MYDVVPNHGEPYQLIASSDLFAHWYANLSTYLQKAVQIMTMTRARIKDDDDDKDEENGLDMEPLLEAGSGTAIGKCKKVYKDYGNLVQYLRVMSLGLTNREGRKLGDFV
jgi:hypothetical protein